MDTNKILKFPTKTRNDSQDIESILTVDLEELNNVVDSEIERYILARNMLFFEESVRNLLEEYGSEFTIDVLKKTIEHIKENS